MLPQVAIAPSAHNTMQPVVWEEMAVTSLSASTPVWVTRFGTIAVVVPPLPSWPTSLRPHDARVPSEHSTRLCHSPAATATTVFPASTPERSTKTGTLLLVVLLFPKPPYVFPPQAARVPSAHSAKTWEVPAVTATTVLPANTPERSTKTGAVLSLGVLLPNWP